MPIRGKILTVDDNADICETFRDILQIEDYEVSMAYSGKEALDLAAAVRFDVVLMDVKMPGMDGLEAMKRLKVISPGTPVIMVTAYATEGLVEEALREGAVAALQKPVDFEELFSTLRTACRGTGPYGA